MRAVAQAGTDAEHICNAVQLLPGPSTCPRTKDAVVTCRQLHASDVQRDCCGRIPPCHLSDLLVCARAASLVGQQEAVQPETCHKGTAAISIGADSLNSLPAF